MPFSSLVLVFPLVSAKGVLVKRGDRAYWIYIYSEFFLNILSALFQEGSFPDILCSQQRKKRVEETLFQKDVQNGSWLGFFCQCTWQVSLLP